MLEIWTFIGVKMAVTRFVTHITHVSRHFGVYNIKKQNKKQLSRENLFVHKTTFRKNAKK